MSKTLLVVPEAPAQQAATAVAQRAIGGKRLRVGILDNSKSNADHLLGMLVAGLQSEMNVASVVALRKPAASLPAQVEVLDRLTQEADIVVSAMAD